MTGMKTPEELRKMGIVVGDVLPPEPRTEAEKLEQKIARKNQERAQGRARKARARRLKAARQKRWVEKHKEEWRAYVKGWRKQRRLSQQESIRAEEPRSQQDAE